MNAFSRDDNSYLSRWWWTVDKVLLVLVGVMLLLGFLLALTASPAVAERHNLDAMHFFLRQGVFLALAIFVLLAVSILPEKWIRRMAILGTAGAIMGLVATLALGFEANGARRWIYLGGFSLQVSEFLKPLFAVFSAWILSSQFADPTIPAKKILLVPLLLICNLLLSQPDFGQTLLILTVWLAQMTLAGMPLILLGILAFIVVGVLGVGYMTSGHVRHRLQAYFDPASADTYQTDKALEALGAGGLLGRGPGEGQVKMNLPDAHTDYIYAVIGEEFGAIACLLLLLLYGGIVLRILAGLLEEENAFKLLACAGLIIQFGLQMMINVGVNVALLPSKGMTLPFISYGGSSLVATSMAMGMLLALTRKNRRFVARISNRKWQAI